MIEEPPLLRIRREWPRPSAEQVAAFRDAPTSMVSDALGGGGAMRAGIAPLGRGEARAVAGPALPVANGPGNLLALLAALAFARPGDVVVSGVSGHDGCAALGDRVCGMMRNAGAAAIVTDGPVRDSAGIERVGLPVWCTGLVPNTPFPNGPGTVGLPALVGGVMVGPGDIVVADADGVVVVPFAEIDRVAARLAHVRALESALDEKVEQGLVVPPEIEKLLAGPRIDWQD